uniref:Sigma-54-dependent Fis family transcriptional regulator n=1 Tax=candidate division WOR-3 bacterium TaxID=2052148 RepID=A0A7C4CAY4_UNCW3
MKPRILVVDDDPGIRALLAELLTDQGYVAVTAPDGTEALACAAEGDFSLVLLDYQLPDMDGLRVLAELKKTRPSLPVVMVSGYGTIKVAVEAAKQGAYDFIEKPLDEDRVLVAVRNALERDRLRREVDALREETRGRYRMVGTSEPMQRMYEMIERVAPTRASVLILGENGSGKELVARAIHQKSAVAQGPFVRLNCAAIPQDLIESELFGHEKGAFTGAVAQKPGKLEMADKGTVLLDEVGDLSLAAQAKLLRFLQDGELQHVGGSQTVRVEVRVIAATNHNLAQAMKEKRFRDDLYYRLSVVVIHVPPLRERRDDIPLLATHFLEQACVEHGVPPKTLTEDALRLLASQPWPGNVRELDHAMQRCVVLLQQPVLSARDIQPLLAPVSAPGSAVEGRSLRAARDEFERQYILKVLADCDWNVTEAARILEVDRTALYRIFERLNIPTNRQSS